MTSPLSNPRDPSEPSITESLALMYVGLPTVIFLAGWIVFPLGPIAAVLVAIAVMSVAVRRRDRRMPKLDVLLLPVIVVAALWTVVAGVGHWTYANTDWVVRDAVLVDLIRDPWPVFYRFDAGDLVLRAPIGFFLPSALVGKLFGIAVAEQSILLWTMGGVVLTFALMMRDRPSPKATLVRLVIFIAFSGMDIVGTVTHYKPFALGDHIEWWAFLFQYSSQTTQLFWVPNHALPGWIAIAWVIGQDPRRLSMTMAVLFVVLAPLWSPLTAIGIAPILGVAIVRRVLSAPIASSIKALLDWRMLAPLIASASLVFPYLVAGSSDVASGSNGAIRWVGEEIVARYIEFVLFEFVGFALLLLYRDPRDPLLWAAVVTLLLLPLKRFGPANDLAMRGSIAALTLLAIRMGDWLSTPRAFARSPRAFVVGVVLLVIGAVTPLMEFARAFQEPVWHLDEHASVADVTRGTHYLTSPEHPWLRRFLKHDAN